MAKGRARPASKVKPAKSHAARGDERPPIESPLTDFIVVGVGASAGGFDAFSELLQAIPGDAKMSIIFVQHLAPGYDSALTSLLSTHSKLPVIEVTEGVRAERSCVYVVPPNAQMTLMDGHLHLDPRPLDKSQYTPIDFFFRSLARTLGSRAIGIVLSGTASDGADGLREIKLAGGITIAQDPETARYDGMPRAAIATGQVDIVLPPEQIAAKLLEIADNPLLVIPPRDTRQSKRRDPPITEDQLERVLAILLPSCGVNFAQYKTPTIIRRLMRRMALLHLSEVEQYIQYLQKHAEEVVNLHNDLLIHVTRFFREPEAFDALASDILPALLTESTPDSPFRAWVAGCATGEEAYSLAIVVLEAIADRLGEKRIQIFGTDVSEGAIEFARHGMYPASVADDVSPERLRRFFTKIDGGYHVTKALRDVCVFARQDLTRDPPFSRLDLVCCRNVLIYMDVALQKKLLSIFQYALKPDGVLLLGRAETIGYNSELFTLINKRHHTYRKKAGVALPAGLLDTTRRVKTSEARLSPADTSARPRTVLQEANRVLMDRFAPPSVLLDENLHIVQFNGQTGPFLQPSPGEPSFHVLKLAREGLLHGLRAALTAARKGRRPVRQTGLRVRDGSSWREINVEVVPLMQQNRVFYLVLFERPPVTQKKQAPKSGGPGSRRTAERLDQRVARLEQELASTREYLQSTIQEIEAANEELQSANEEILSSNEELQSTNEELDTAKEELQSTNEELNTVNDELHGRNDELTHVNADLVNLLGSVQIAIVIVTNDLRIRRFTPMAEKILNLIPGDIGRPFSQITSTIDYPGLPALIAETIDTMTSVEREVRDIEGRRYVLRIRPYKSADNRIDGAVIALFDIDGSKVASASGTPTAQ